MSPYPKTSLALSGLFFAIAICSVEAQVTAQVTAEVEIHALIQAVEESGCEFERNGRRYDALEAADHMRLKYRRAKRYADSAEKFIDRLASKSSISGKPYLIVCATSGEHEAKEWLEAELVAQRKRS
ncbi:MAG: DUF5329 domain-containing protein [Pseudohongiellaceae bacterium]